MIQNTKYTKRKKKDMQKMLYAWSSAVGGEFFPLGTWSSHLILWQSVTFKLSTQSRVSSIILLYILCNRVSSFYTFSAVRGDPSACVHTAWLLVRPSEGTNSIASNVFNESLPSFNPTLDQQVWKGHHPSLMNFQNDREGATWWHHH